MAREYKKGIYTLKEIGAEAMRKYPGRWANEESAYASVKNTARALNVGDINGKKKYKLIAAVDVARIFESLEKTNRGKKKGLGQANLFDLFPEPKHTCTPEPTPETPKATTTPVQIDDIQAPDLEELAVCADALARAFCNFALALASYKQGG